MESPAQNFKNMGSSFLQCRAMLGLEETQEFYYVIQETFSTVNHILVSMELEI